MGTALLLNGVSALFLAQPIAVSDALIERLAQTNAKVEQFDFSPDGQRITYLSAKNGQYDIWVMNADGSNPRPLTTQVPVHQAFDGATIYPQWSPNGDWISYTSRGETYLISPDGTGPPVNVSYGQGGLRPRWTPDSQWLVSTPGVEFVTGFPQILLLRAEIPSGAIEVKHLTDEPYGHSDPQVSPDGQWVAFTSSRPDPETGQRVGGVWLVSMAGGKPRLVAAGAGSPRWSPDGSRLAVVAAQPSGWRNVGVVEIADSRVHMLTSSPWDEGNPRWSPDGRWIAYVANKSWNLHLMKVGAEGGTTHQLTDRPGVSGGFESGQVRGTFRWSPDGRSIAYTYMSHAACSDIWMMSADGGSPRQLTHHMPSELAEHDFIAPELITYRSKGDLEVPAFLYTPRKTQSGRKPPLLVYARANVNGMHVDGFYPFIQYFVDRGYVVLAPQVRGSSGKGRDYGRLNYGDWGGGDVDDIAAGVEHLAARGIIDPDRVVMQGGSTGGYHTMQTIVRYPDLLRAAVNLYGPTNLVHMDDYSVTKATLASVVRGNHGGPDEAPEHWRSRSAYFNIDRVKTPLLILWGELDSGVRPSMAAEYHRLAKQKGKRVDYVLYSMEPHGWYNWRPATLKDALARVARHYAERVGQ